jgi:hypothetical protein
MADNKVSDHDYVDPEKVRRNTVQFLASKPRTKVSTGGFNANYETNYRRHKGDELPAPSRQGK